MSAIVGLTVYTDLVGAGGTPVIDIPDVDNGRLVEGVDLGAEESLQFAVPRTSPALASIVASSKRVIRVWHNDGTFSEWPLAQDANPYVGGDGLVQITCEAAVLRMAQLGFMETVDAGGRRVFAESYAGFTPSDYVDLVVTRLAALGASYITKGTIDPTVALDLSWNYAVPLAVVLQVRDAVKSADIPCEFDFRRNGSSGYYIDMVSEIGSSAAIPELRAKKSITALQYVRNRTRQITVCQPKGPTDASGYEGTIARARWEVSAVNGGTKRLTLADPAGGSGPIAVDDQFNGLYLFREKTGRTFLIVDTLEATQEIELADVSTFAAHAVTAPEWVSFRATEPNTGSRRIGATSVADAFVHEVTNVAGVVLTVREFSFGADILNVDNRFIDWRAERATYVGADGTANVTVAGRIDCGSSVAGYAIGDVCLLIAAAAHPYNIMQPMCTITSLDTVNKYLYVSLRYGSGSLTIMSGTKLRVYRPVATTHLITDSATAAKTLTVDAAGTAATNDVLLRLYQPCHGTQLCELTDPANVSAYGRRLGLLARPESGEVNRVPNSIMRTWPGSASAAPDGWTWTGTGAATIARANTVAEHGPYSALCVFASGSTVGQLRTPPTFIHPTADESTVSVRARLQMTDFDDGSAWDPTYTYVYTVRSTLTMTLYKETPYGTRTAIGSVTIGCPNFANGVALDTWLDLAIPAVDISALEDETLVVGFASAWGGSVPGALIKGYVDAVQITQTINAPRALPLLLHEHGEATALHQAANFELQVWAAPPMEVTVSALDLERVDGTAFSADALTKGGSVRIIAPDEAIDDTLRVLRMDRSLTDQADTQLTVANRAMLLTDMLSGGSAAASGAGSGAQSIVSTVRRVMSQNWLDLINRPEVFPPEEHAHHPDDLVGTRSSDYEARGAGAGYAVGLARIDASETAIVALNGGAVTTFAQIVAPASFIHLFVAANNGSTDAFEDEVLVCGIGAFSITEIRKTDTIGTPGARTYSLAAGAICVAIAGGPPAKFFDLRFLAIHFP